MSTSLLVVIKGSNGYTGSTGILSVTSQVIQFYSKWDAERAESQLYEDFKESSFTIKTTILEGTA